MGRHFSRAVIAMCVMTLLTAGACIIKTRPHSKRSHVTHVKHQKHGKHKKHKKPKKHKKHKHRR